VMTLSYGVNKYICQQICKGRAQLPPPIDEVLSIMLLLFAFLYCIYC